MVKWQSFMLLIGVGLSVRGIAQTQKAPLITQGIDETKLVRLQNTVHPLTRAGQDLGAVSDSFPTGRLVLLLKRPAEQETALQTFLNDVHRRGAANYHHWVTPEEYGDRFGAGDFDMQTASTWLRSQGFNVSSVTKSRQFIEFSGTAGQLRQAFHTEIHQYSVQGETHYANATDLSIPVALAPLVRGISPINDFRAQPLIKLAGRARYSPAGNKTTPEWTVPNPFGSANANAYSVAPEDFAAQYDLAPLYQAGVDGTGQTIGIINESNVDVSLVNSYRQLFGLVANPTQVVIDGADPGTLANLDTEAYLDVELSGAVAPKATVNLYIADGSELQDPIQLAAIRAVEDNQASVLSVSFGQCEAALGDAGNQLWAGLWEQAAAQGQTVLVAVGDSGPECNYEQGVSGLASTPWNIAVGGTDFYYSDYASGAPSATALWNQTNDSQLGSLKASLPEQVWNDPFGLDAISDGLQQNEIDAGGGGASSCSTQSSTGVCSGGYSKPSWQAGPGVPADKVRDLPDVSLFASNGANLSAYPICAAEGECTASSGAETEIALVGGTSASTPAMAGIMALVDQKYGRQGQADFTLYPLAQQKSAAFHDITLGSNRALCISESVDCAVDASGYSASTVYSAGPNYDLASGLGSVDADLLVSSWNSIVFQPTATTLHLSSSSITHGTPVNITTSVASTSTSGTPTGDVAILTNSSLPSSQSQTFLTLSGGMAGSTIDSLPGGDYQVSATYGGDGVFAGSTSSPVNLSVSPENSSISISVTSGQNPLNLNVSTLSYNQPFALNVQPIGAGAATAAGTANGRATGTATFTLDSISETVPLNGAGIANWSPPQPTVGTHKASATYSGDASFNASSALPITFNVNKGYASINVNVDAPASAFLPGWQVTPGSNVTVTVTVAPGYSGYNPDAAAPTGQVTVCLGPPVTNVCISPSYSQTAILSAPSGSNSANSVATVTFQNLAAGYYFPSVAYAGDATWQPGGLADTGGLSVAPISSLVPTETALTVAPATISGNQPATVTTTVSSARSSGFAPTGEIEFYDNGIFLTYTLLNAGKAGAINSVSFQLNPANFWTNGVNEITAIYDGDSYYAPSTSSVANVSVTQPAGDFTLTPQLSQITVQSGKSGSIGLNLASLDNFNGVVTLTCAPSSSNIGCGVTPSAPALNGTATATLSVNTAMQTAGLPAHSGNRYGVLKIPGGLVLASLLLGGFTRRTRRLPLVCNLCFFAALLTMVSCGGGATKEGQPSPSDPDAGTYSIVVNATAGGIVHNVRVTVVVP